jgi:DNA-binding winged helix-turn-helix (wHTH) protein
LAQSFLATEELSGSTGTLLFLEGGWSMNNWVISFGPFRVSKSRRLLERNGEPVQIGSRAFDILTHLLEHPGRVVSHRALLDAAWPGATVEDGNLRFQMTALRKALGNGETKYIVNVPGRGYCFVAAIARHGDTELAEVLSHPSSERLTSPPRPAKLVGRDEVIVKISSLVRAHRVVTVVGAGGIGKTSIAAVVAGQLGNAFGDRICFVELGSVEDPRRTADGLAVALRLPVTSEEPVDDIVRALKSRQMLIVVDGCERQIDAAAVLIDKIARSLGGFAILADFRKETSRN